MEYNNKNIKNAEMDGNSYDSGMKALSKSVHTAFIILLVVILVMLLRFITFGGYFAVKAQEAVIVLQFGKFKECHTKDWHWYLPYPVNRFIKIQTSPQFLKVNFSSLNAAMAEKPEQLGSLNMVRDRYLITADGNILHANWTLSYHVSDPEKYYQRCMVAGELDKEDENFYEGSVKLGPRGPRTILKNLFTESAINITAQYTVSDVYDLHRNEYASKVEADFAKRILDADLGLVLDYATLNSVIPPAQIAQAFNEVSVAMNQKVVMKNQAEEYSLKVVNDAKSAAAVILADAENYRTQVVADVMAEKSYFSSILEEYKKNPDTVLMTLYHNALSDILKSQENKYIIGSSSASEGQQIRIKLNPEAPKRKENNKDAMGVK
jgi:membrane protease subunit HflK